MDDLSPNEYELEVPSTDSFAPHTDSHSQGTLIRFEKINDGIRNSLDNLKKTIALYFRFSLIDEDFKIFIQDEIVDISCHEDLSSNTEFLWQLNEMEDPYISTLEELVDKKRLITVPDIDANICGFLASVKKPRQLNIVGTGEQVKVDLFVNGRLRERDILRHIPTARVAESYIYGQIHFNKLEDDAVDRFTSSRESVVANDPLFEDLLNKIQEKIMKLVLVDWDDWRRGKREDGDPDSESIAKRDRKSEELFNVVADEYASNVDAGKPVQKVNEWIKEISADATFGFSSFAECYVAENLVRKYIVDQSVSMTSTAAEEVERRRSAEAQNKEKGNLNIDIRYNNDDLNYLDMGFLTRLVDEPSGNTTIVNDAKQYKPLRDALMHTSILTDEAKKKLTSVFDNIKARIINFLNVDS